MTTAPHATRLRFEGQLLHVVLLSALLLLLLAASRLPGFGSGQLLGLDTPIWVALAVGDAILHQAYVWFCWRWELHGGALSRRFGERAFPLYAVGFAVLILARPLLLTLVAIANRGALPGPPAWSSTLALALAIPAGYTLYCAQRYFGFHRAFGRDHFDAAYRAMPLVRRGVFRFTSNGMYAFGLLVLWLPGLLLHSLAATAVAVFSHLYIWVHYLCTERPDLERIYGERR